MKPRSDTAQFPLLLGGATVLAFLAIARLPRFPQVLQAPSTPFDRSAAPDAATDYHLLREAASVVPPDASVAALSQPRSPLRETTLHRAAVALLPGRKVVPAALWNVPTYQENQADFLIVAGPKPSPPPGTMLLETPWGTVWKRIRP
jgi:hypothetical protein